MLPRVLEAEVMDTAEEADDYDAMDHADVNQAFAVDLLAARTAIASVVDLGAGTALIPIRLCRLHPTLRITAVEAASHMLSRAQQNLDAASVADRVTLANCDAKQTGLPEHAFDVVASNSVVHHMAEPALLFQEALRLVARGGLVFLRDLCRPPSEAALHALVARYAPASEAAAGAGPNARQRDLFRASLWAALTLDEMREMCRAFSLPPACVSMTSDRHWPLSHRAPH